MKGWCVIPERMNVCDFVQAPSPYTGLSLCTMNVEYVRNFSTDTQVFNVRVPTTSVLRCAKSLLAAKTPGDRWGQLFPTPGQLWQERCLKKTSLALPIVYCLGTHLKGWQPTMVASLSIYQSVVTKHFAHHPKKKE